MRNKERDPGNTQEIEKSNIFADNVLLNEAVNVLSDEVGLLKAHPKPLASMFAKP